MSDVIDDRVKMYMKEITLMKIINYLNFILVIG